MTQEDAQTETEKVVPVSFDLLEGTSESARAKTAEAFLELLGAQLRNPNTRSAYRVPGAHFWHFVRPVSRKNKGKNTRYRCTRRQKKRSILGLNALTWHQMPVLHFFLPSARIVKRLNRGAWIVGVS